jgi:hypothetical protein
LKKLKKKEILSDIRKREKLKEIGEWKLLERKNPRI